MKNKENQTNLIRRLRNTFDGWMNIISGFGGKQDKRNNFDFYALEKLPETTRWYYYQGDRIMAKVINLVPDWSFKKELKINSDYVKELEDFYKDINLYQNLKTLWKYARIQNGAIWVLDIDDGQSEEMPVNFNNIRSIKPGIIISSEYLRPDNSYDARKSERMTIISFNGEAERLIHSDRYLFVDGEDCGYFIRSIDFGFGSSYLDQMAGHVKDYNIAHQIPNILLTDYSKPVYKLAGLNEMLNSDAEDQIMTKMQTMDMVSSVINAVVMDKEDDYERKTTNVSGLDNLIKQPERKLCAVSGIPHTLLLSESPGGTLSQTGTLQQADWYDKVETERIEKINPVLDKLNNLWVNMFLGKDEYISWEWQPLKTMTEKESAEVEKITAETYSILISDQVMTSQEVREKYDYSESDMILKEDSELRKILDSVNENVETD